MALALEAVDLVAICAVLLLIGLLIAVRFTFVRMAGALDVDIFGYRPFSGVASSIENYVVDGLNDGIAALEHVATTLWHWSSVAMVTMADGLLAFVHDVGAGVHWLVNHGIPDAVHAIVDRIDVVAVEAHRLALSALADIRTETAGRVAAVEHAIATVEGWATGELHALRRTIEGEALRDFPQVERDVEALVAQAVATIEHATDLTASTLSGAAEEALQNAERVATLTAEDLRRLLANLNPADVAKLIAAIPVIAAAIAALEAETGLSNAECRRKIKGVCGVDPARWLHFLEGLAFVFAWPGLEQFAQDVADGMGEVVDAITDFAGV